MAKSKKSKRRHRRNNQPRTTMADIVRQLDEERRGRDGDATITAVPSHGPPPDEPSVLVLAAPPAVSDPIEEPHEPLAATDPLFGTASAVVPQLGRPSYAAAPEDHEDPEDHPKTVGRVGRLFRKGWSGLRLLASLPIWLFRGLTFPVTWLAGGIDWIARGADSSALRFARWINGQPAASVNPGSRRRRIANRLLRFVRTVIASPVWATRGVVTLPLQKLTGFAAGITSSLDRRTVSTARWIGPFGT